MDFGKIKQQLQFNEILKVFKTFVKAEENRSVVDKLLPFDNIYDANEEINEIRCWTELLKENPLPDIDIGDLTPYFIVLKKEGTYLQPQELILFSHFIYISGLYYKLIDNISEDYGLLSIKYNKKIFQFKYIENLIKNTFDESGEFYDGASHELQSIRSKIRDTRSKILNKLNDFIFSGFASTVIRETIVTIRNNRFVIPLKPNFSQKVKGIIQDYSSSGQTVFVEPDFVVSLNNKLSYLKQEEFYEKIRILTEITDVLRDNFFELNQSYKTLLKIDLKIGKAKLGIKYNFNLINLNKELFSATEVRNPILTVQNKDVVPIDILFKNKRVLIITGANTGGKTVALKTAGLITVMAQMGFPVPVNSESKIKFFSNIFIDIGDAQNLSEDLSTFSAHINNINTFLESCDKDSLILIDELGTGTDPKDGAAIGRALIEYFLKKGSFVIITTHIEDLKYLNYIYDKIENVSVNFDEETIKPRYSLLYGISGKSYAIKIAEKLQFNKEVIELSKSFYNKSTTEFLQNVINIENLKKELLDKEKKLFMEKQQISIEKEKYRKLKEKLIKEKDKIKNLIKAKYNKKYEKLIIKFDNLLQQLRDVLTAKEYAKLVSEKKKDIKELKKEVTEKKSEHVEVFNYSNSISDFFIGKRIKHTKTGIRGRVTHIDTTSKNIEVILENNLKITVNYKEIVPVDENKNSEFSINYHYDTPVKLFKLNLIGKRVEEGIAELEKYIDHAILQDADKIEIIHGLGSGKLKKGITEYLKSSSLIKNYYSPIEQNGGLGITIAVLK